MPYLNIQDKVIYYEYINKSDLINNKPIIIFLHEGLGSIAQWKKFPKILCDTLKLPGFVYDRNGHGKSSFLKEKRNNLFLHSEANFLRHLINILEIKNDLILFGHSDGGTLAFIFANKYPELLKAIITEAHHVIVENITKKGINEAVKFYKSGILKSLLEKYHAGKTESMFYGWADTWLNMEIEKWSIIDLLKNISTPVLSIQGKNDNYGTEYQLDAVKNNCKGKTEIHLLDDCGHIPHLHQKDRVIEIIKGFFSNNKMM